MCWNPATTVCKSLVVFCFPSGFRNFEARVRPSKVRFPIHARVAKYAAQSVDPQFMSELACTPCSCMIVRRFLLPTFVLFVPQAGVYSFFQSAGVLLLEHLRGIKWYVIPQRWTEVDKNQAAKLGVHIPPRRELKTEIRMGKMKKNKQMAKQARVITTQEQPKHSEQQFHCVSTTN